MILRYNFGRILLFIIYMFISKCTNYIVTDFTFSGEHEIYKNLLHNYNEVCHYYKVGLNWYE